jgi:O-antigen ligase
MNRRPQTWLLLCLIGVVLSALLIGAVLSAKRHALSHNTVQFYTPLAADAEWQGDWKLSERGADPSQAGSLAGTDRVTIPFVGSQLALQVRRGSYRAYLWVSVDGKPANRLPRTERGAYLVLSSPDNEPQVTAIPVAGGLSDESHVAEVVADQGWDHWPLVGWRVKRGPDTLGYDRALTGLTAIAVVFLLGAIGWGAQAARQSRRLAEDPPTLASLSAISEPRFPLSLFRSPVSLIVAAAVFYASPWLPLTLVGGAALAVIITLRLDLGLALVAFSAPFYLYPRPLLGKSFSMAEIATLLCMVPWGVRQIQRSIPRSLVSMLRGLSLADFAVLSLALTAAVSVAFADYGHVALRELRVVILEPALFYLMLRTSNVNEQGVWRIVHAFVGGAVAVALIGLSQYALDINVITAEQGFRRLRSVYGSPNNAALYLGRTLPVLIAVALFATRRRWRVVYGVLAAPVALALLLTFSRAAILLGVPASLLALGVLAGGRWRWIALAVVAAAALAIVPLLSTPRFAGLLDPRTGTLFFRLQLWRSSWKMFLDHPWLGVGPDNFLYQYRGRYILPSAWQEPHLSHAHNVLLSYATRLGLLGLGAGVLLHFSFWRRALGPGNIPDRDHRALALGLAGSMTYTLAHGLVDASYFFVDLAFAFLLALGLVEWLSRSNTHGQKD